MNENKLDYADIKQFARLTLASHLKVFLDNSEWQQHALEKTRLKGRLSERDDRRLMREIQRLVEDTIIELQKV